MGHRKTLRSPTAIMTFGVSTVVAAHFVAGTASPSARENIAKDRGHLQGTPHATDQNLLASVVHTSSTHGGAAGAGLLPLAVDGSEHPEQVPDNIAYRHFISTISEAADATPQQRDRRQVFLKRVGLSQEDYEAVLQSVENLREQLTAIREQRAMLDRTASATALQTLRLQEGQLFEATRLRIISALTSDGRRQLDSYIQENVKRRIKIYGTRTM